MYCVYDIQDIMLKCNLKGIGGERLFNILAKTIANKNNEQLLLNQNINTAPRIHIMGSKYLHLLVVIVHILKLLK